ncbi:hypothetical protein Psuf_038860 [Phytohabitans suffuscus]|uniref:Uncharacterized protein n=1 Tax=Phytohabitans suffuscus TaxID=624315 RepID=A0A6F8YKK3_9ACTN|nr:hypothetical protein Psuf_038860 [Phytohabitans suffuscus]
MENKPDLTSTPVVFASRVMPPTGALRTNGPIHERVTEARRMAGAVAHEAIWMLPAWTVMPDDARMSMAGTASVPSMRTFKILMSCWPSMTNPAVGPTIIGRAPADTDRKVIGWSGVPDLATAIRSG